MSLQKLKEENFWDVFEQTNSSKQVDCREQNILLAVSGGLDSISMLDFFCRYKSKLQWKKLGVIHINHGLRGKNSDLDEELVRQECLRNKVEFFSERLALNFIKNRRGLEDSARDERYRIFAKFQNKGFDICCTAHTNDDQLETLLMRIDRGTGLKGLRGIPVLRENWIWRPFLSLRRKDLEKYMEIHSLAWREDASNKELIYTRNKFRLNFISKLSEKWNLSYEQLLEKANDISRLASADFEMAKLISLSLYENCELECPSFSQAKLIWNYKKIQKTWSDSERDEDLFFIYLQYCLDSLNGPKLRKKTMPLVVDLLKGKKHKIEVSKGWILGHSAGKLYIREPNESEITPKFKEIDIDIGFEHQISTSYKGNNYLLSVILSDLHDLNPNNTIRSDGEFCTCLDYDQIKGTKISLRTRQNGDLFAPNGLKTQKRKFKMAQAEAGIMEFDRDSLIVLAISDEVLYSPFVGVSENYRVKENTKNILGLQCLKIKNQ